MPMERLPCGCQMDTQVVDGENIFIYEPCSLTCEYYLYTVAETRRQGKDVRTIDVR